MAVFTVFAYGTGESEAKTKNIVSQFRQSCSGEHIYIDGPKLLGTEVLPNAKKGAQQIVAWLKAQESEDNTINLTGFSRGSVTCIHIANHLKNLEKKLELKKYYWERNGKQLNDSDQKLLNQLKKMDLNMFLMDPVAGITDKGMQNAKIIPDNVKNYVAVLQLDERRRDFKPQDMTRAIIASSEKTKVTMLPMFGNHSDTTKIKHEGMQSGPKIAWYSLHQFLKKHGTEFKKDGNEIIPEIVSSKREKSPLPAITDPKELLKLFCENHKERNNYYQSGLTAKLVDGIPAPRVQRTMNDHLRYYVKNSAFFVNQLERELFKVSYPITFNYLFEKNLLDPRFPSNSKPEEVIAELAQLKKENPGLFHDLKPFGVKNNGEQIGLGKPRGYHYLEPCTSMQQVYPDLLPESVKTHAAQMNKLPALEMEIYRATFNYQRDKLTIDFFGGRNQSGRAQQLREDINHIVNNQEGSREEKYNKVLDKLEQNYKEMVLSNNNSELRDILKDLLSRNGRQYIINEAGLLNGLLTELSYSLFTLVQKIVSFVGNLGYIGGGVLYTLGSALQSIGQRSLELLGKIDNPVKVVAFIAASLLEAAGSVIQSSFGLAPLTLLATQGIAMMRDVFIQSFNTTQMEQVVDVKIPKDNNVAPLHIAQNPSEKTDEISVVQEPVKIASTDFKQRYKAIQNNANTTDKEIASEAEELTSLKI